MPSALRGRPSRRYSVRNTHRRERPGGAGARPRRPRGGPRSSAPPAGAALASPALASPADAASARPPSAWVPVGDPAGPAVPRTVPRVFSPAVAVRAPITTHTTSFPFRLSLATDLSHDRAVRPTGPGRRLAPRLVVPLDAAARPRPRLPPVQAASPPLRHGPLTSSRRGRSRWLPLRPRPRRLPLR